MAALLLPVAGALLGASLAAGSSTSPRLAQLAYELGAKSRTTELRKEDLLYGCAKVPDCARGCERRLERLGDGRDPGRAPPCPGLTVKEGEDETAAAVALVRGRLRDAAFARPLLDRRDDDRLQCGVARLGLAPSQAEACAREEARVLPVALDGAPRGDDAAPFLFAICAVRPAARGSAPSRGRARASPRSRRAPARASRSAIAPPSPAGSSGSASRRSRPPAARRPSARSGSSLRRSAAVPERQPDAADPRKPLVDRAVTRC